MSGIIISSKDYKSSVNQFFLRSYENTILNLKDKESLLTLSCNLRLFNNNPLSLKLFLFYSVRMVEDQS